MSPNFREYRAGLPAAKFAANRTLSLERKSNNHGDNGKREQGNTRQHVLAPNGIIVSIINFAVRL